MQIFEVAEVIEVVQDDSLKLIRCVADSRFEFRISHLAHLKVCVSRHDAQVLDVEVL